MTKMNRLTVRVERAIKLTKNTGRQPGNNLTAASRLLGVSRTTVARWDSRIQEQGTVGLSKGWERNALAKEPTVAQQSKAIQTIYSSTFKRSGGSTALASSRLGISERTLKRHLVKIETGEPAYTTKAGATKAIVKASSSPKEFIGGAAFKKVDQRKGKRHLERSYLVTAGRRPPSFKKRAAYQVIITDKRTGKRSVVSSLSVDFETAMAEAVAKASRYKNFEAGEIFLRVLQYDKVIQV